MKYLSGETPQVGDVVECVEVDGFRLKLGLYEITGLTCMDCLAIWIDKMEVRGYSPSRFVKIGRI